MVNVERKGASHTRGFCLPTSVRRPPRTKIRWPMEEDLQHEGGWSCRGGWWRGGLAVGGYLWLRKLVRHDKEAADMDSARGTDVLHTGYFKGLSGGWVPTST